LEHQKNFIIVWWQSSFAFRWFFLSPDLLPKVFSLNISAFRKLLSGKNKSYFILLKK